MFRIPAIVDEDGLFMTTAQLQFFMNRKNGHKMIKEKSEDFVKYFNQCRIYNLLYELTEEDYNAAQFYWDEENESVGVMFSKNGKAAKALEDVALVEFEDGDEDFEIEF
jgi:hypothetical protein